MASVITKQNLHRRHFLRGAGVALGLPLLDAMVPAFARAEINPVPRRFFGICNNLGLLPDLFFPAADSAGKGYQAGLRTTKNTWSVERPSVSSLDDLLWSSAALFSSWESVTISKPAFSISDFTVS